MEIPSRHTRKAVRDLTLMGWEVPSIAAVLGLSVRTVQLYRQSARRCVVEIRAEFHHLAAEIGRDEP